MTVFSTTESVLLDHIAIRLELARLSPLDRTLIELRFAYRIPADYAGIWPPDKTSIGAYAGRKHLGRPLSATRTQVRITRILDRWRRRYHASYHGSHDHPSNHLRAA